MKRVEQSQANNHVAIVIGQLSHGGAEKQTVLLAKGLLMSAKFVPVVFCLSTHVEPHGQSLTDAGVKLHRIPEGTAPGFPKLWWLVNQLRKMNCSLIYGILHIGNIYGGAAATLLRLPFVASLRSANFMLPVHIRILSSLLSRSASLVICNSLSCRETAIQRMGISSRRAVIVNNAILMQNTKPASRQEIRREFGIPQAAVVIGTVANLKWPKRFQFFLEVFKHCYHKASSLTKMSGSLLHFLWLGDGPERVSLEAAIANMPDEQRSQVHFPGARKDIAECLSSLDIFILTSAYEGLPNALLEAMASGLPCVATKVPGTVDVLEARPGMGVLGDPDDPAKFADTVISLLSDNQRRSELAGVAKEYVNRSYSLENLVATTEKLFDSVVQAR